MTVRIAKDGGVELSGDCPSSDAEALVQLLIAQPTALVDWRGCQSAHTAVIQVLIAADKRPSGVPAGAFLANWVEPLFNRR